MKKSLLALAVLGAFAGVASAQSSVTIFGVLDLAISRGNGGTAAGDSNPGANGTSKAYLMRQSAASRLGFRGTEDMGGGLSAQFNIEHRFTPDNGNTTATPFWAGRSYVQLTSAAVGSVYLGREYTPAFWPAVKTDPFGWDGVGQVSFGQYAKFRSTAAVRTDNTVGYKSASFGGVTVQAAVGLGEAVLGRTTGFNVEYGGGPIYAGVGFEKINNGPAALAGNQMINFGAAYDLGFIRPAIYFASTKTGVGSTAKNKDIMLALTAPIGPAKIKFAVNRLDPQGASNNETHLGLGVDYALSKRTGLYADFGRGTQDAPVGPKPTNNQAVAVGVKHTF